MTVKERYEGIAMQWELAGRPAHLLLTQGWPFASVYLWTFSDGAAKEGVSTLLMAYINESKVALEVASPGWYERFFFTGQREHCEHCAGAWLRENLSFCTDCHAQYCFDCSCRYEKGLNGNRMHGCGGEIVG